MQDYRSVARTFMVSIAAILLAVILLSLMVPAHSAMPAFPIEIPPDAPSPPPNLAVPHERTENFSGISITGGIAGITEGGESTEGTPPAPPVVPVNPTPPVPEFSSLAIPVSLITGCIGCIMYIKKVRIS